MTVHLEENEKHAFLQCYACTRESVTNVLWMYLVRPVSCCWELMSPLLKCLGCLPQLWLLLPLGELAVLGSRPAAARTYPPQRC